MSSIAPVNQKIRINILRLAFVLLIPCLFLIRPYSYPVETALVELFEVAGFLLLVAAILGRFWSILFAGGRKNMIVLDQGPYSICRHPLYLFSTLGGFGLGLLLGSVLLSLIVGGVLLTILSVTAKREERFLVAEFGREYLDYRARVPMIVPNFKLYQAPEWVEFSTRTLRTNLFDAFVFMAFFPLAELIEYVVDAYNIAGWAAF